MDDRVGSLLVTMRVIPNSPAAGGAGDGGSQQAQYQKFVHAGLGRGEAARSCDNKSARVNYLFG